MDEQNREYEIGDTVTWSHIYVTGIQDKGEKKNGTKALCEEIIHDNVRKIRKEIN